MMPIYTEYYYWGAHRQERDRYTGRLTVRPGFYVHIWLFGWVVYYTHKDSVYPPEQEAKFAPWADALGVIFTPFSSLFSTKGVH